MIAGYRCIYYLQSKLHDRTVHYHYRNYTWDLTCVVFHMKFKKQAFGQCKILFIVWPVTTIFYRLQNAIISIRKRIVFTGVVNVISYTRQSVITHVVIRFLWHDFIHWINGWMDDLRFYVLFNSISVISGRWAGDRERLFAMELRLRLRRFHLEWGSSSVR